MSAERHASCISVYYLYLRSFAVMNHYNPNMSAESMRLNLDVVNAIRLQGR